ncbi:hypothetical protein RR46_09043 [Papilio xuthus]|uniref:Uncharacterized protein n=1 Tax=Papilio xuthus TaxID=66420 RepID=A0A194PUQ3_PAPXU|nr:hypothetical protein RR46_09043 [Papilio xuthus]
MHINEALSQHYRRSCTKGHSADDSGAALAARRSGVRWKMCAKRVRQRTIVYCADTTCAVVGCETMCA